MSDSSSVGMRQKPGHVLEPTGLEHRELDAQLAEQLLQDGTQVDHADGAHQRGPRRHYGAGAARDVVPARCAQPADIRDDGLASGNLADVFVDQVAGSGGPARGVDVQHQRADFAVVPDVLQQAGVLGFLDGGADDAVHLDYGNAGLALEKEHNWVSIRRVMIRLYTADRQHWVSN